MKVLVLTNLYPPHFLGGYELICERVVKRLRARGHIVHVVTSDHRTGNEEVNGEEGVYRQLQINGFYGHPWRGIRELRSLERHNNLLLRSVLREFAPDLVYAWNMGGLSKSMLLTLQRLNLPTVYYLSDHWIARGLTSDVWLRWWNNSDVGWKARILRWFWQMVGARRHWQRIAPTNPPRHFVFQRIYFCSAALKQLTAEAGFAVEHGEVIYCPVDTVRFNGQPRGPGDSYRRLLYVGRLAQDKGVMTAAKAIALLKGQEAVSLSIYGRGDDDYVSELKRFVQAHGLDVQFRSARPEHMPEVYRAHDGLVFTSEWAEPFALTPLEAMASGLPVIGTRTGGSAELFRDEENCLTYEAGNAEALAEKMVRFVREPALRARCAAAGYCDVRARCSEPVIVDQIERYLIETLKEWKPVSLPEYNA